MEQRCARCGNSYESDFYGICADCRGQLNERYYKAPVAREESSPQIMKANVQYNAVALKAERDDDDELPTPG